MAIFEGTIKEFSDFIGPLTRNIVCNLSRKSKKKTSCNHEGCGKRTKLEAAHIKGKERSQLIAEILSEYQLEVNMDLYRVDLEEFKDKFIEVHTPITEVIIPLCREHHIEYDKKHYIVQEYPIILDELDEAYTDEELSKLKNNEIEAITENIQSFPIGDIKRFVAQTQNLNASQLTFSKISDSNGLWNFDVKKSKFTKDFAFIFYNQNSNNYKVSIVKANELKITDFPEKDTETIRFFVSQDYKDRTGFDFSSLT